METQTIQYPAEILSALGKEADLILISIGLTQLDTLMLRNEDSLCNS